MNDLIEKLREDVLAQWAVFLGALTLVVFFGLPVFENRLIEKTREAFKKPYNPGGHTYGPFYNPDVVDPNQQQPQPQQQIPQQPQQQFQQPQQPQQQQMQIIPYTQGTPRSWNAYWESQRFGQ